MNADIYLKKKIKNGYIKKDIDLEGASGVKHHFKYMLYNDDHSIVVDISDGKNIEMDIIKLYIKCIDVGIKDGILIVRNGVSVNDKLHNLARKYRIKVIKFSEATFLNK